MKNTNEERISVYVPKGYSGEEPQLFVSVNGVNYLLPRGKESRVPPAVAEELQRALRAEETRERRIGKLTGGAHDSL